MFVHAKDPDSQDQIQPLTNVRQAKVKVSIENVSMAGAGFKVQRQPRAVALTRIAAKLCDITCVQFNAWNQANTFIQFMFTKQCFSAYAIQC